MSTVPAVSIIVAAYNRSNVLRSAIESVLAGTFSDWEMIVVGDHCTDDTQDVVESFKDARIRFLNLPENSGGQSVPNNRGVELARGRYLCFLNQDDLYFPDHLASSIAYIERTGAELIWSPAAVAFPDNREKEDPALMHFMLDGVSVTGNYDPSVFIIASSWFMRREAAGKTGPWRAGAETFESPSQEWLYRAARNGVRMYFCPHVSVMCVHSGLRPNSYGAREFVENKHYQIWLIDPDFRALVYERAAVIMAGALREATEPGIGLAVKRLGWSFVRKLCGLFGAHPVALKHFFRFRRRGAFLAYHRSLVLPDERPKRSED